MRNVNTFTAHPSAKSFRGWIYDWSRCRDDVEGHAIIGADGNGRRITTSTLVRLYRIDCALFIETRNSVYQLVNPHRSRRTA